MISKKEQLEVQIAFMKRISGAIEVLADKEDLSLRSGIMRVHTMFRDLTRYAVKRVDVIEKNKHCVDLFSGEVAELDDETVAAIKKLAHHRSDRPGKIKISIFWEDTNIPDKD